jgi:hypothetical protein
VTVRSRIVWLCIGLILGSLLTSPVSAQAANRMFASLTTDLAGGVSRPVLCTANGSGCYVQVQTH